MQKYYKNHITKQLKLTQIYLYWINLLNMSFNVSYLCGTSIHKTFYRCVQVCFGFYKETLTNHQ